MILRAGPLARPFYMRKLPKKASGKLVKAEREQREIWKKKEGSLSGELSWKKRKIITFEGEKPDFI